MSYGRLLIEFGSEVRRRPFFYEPTLIMIALVVPAVLARKSLPPVAGLGAWLPLTAAGFAIWVVARLLPLRRFAQDASRDRSAFWLLVAAHPFGSVLLGFAGGYVVVRGLNALVPAMQVAPHFAGLVGGVILGFPLGASYWVSAFGYAARRNRARQSRSRRPDKDR